MTCRFLTPPDSYPKQPVVHDHRVPLGGRVLGLDPLHLSLVLCVVVVGQRQSAPGSVLALHAQNHPAVTGVGHVDPIRANVSHAGCATGKGDLGRQL